MSEQHATMTGEEVRQNITIEQIRQRLEAAVVCFEDGNDDVAQVIVRQLLAAVKQKT